MKKMLLKKKIMLVLLCTVMVLTGCAAFDAAAVYDDEKKIASRSNTYNKVNYKQVEVGDTVELSCQVFEGMDTIWTRTLKEDASMVMSYDMEVTNGKAKLVLILPDDSMETIAEVSQEQGTDAGEEITLELKEGLNRIKLVGGEDTSVKLEMTVSE